MTLLPFLSEPLPWHLSRAANGATNTVGCRTEIQLTSPCRQQILNIFWSSTSCHHSEVIGSCAPKDDQGCDIQESIPQGTMMAGKGSSSPSVGDALGSKDSSVLGFEGWQGIVGSVRGFAVLRGLLKCVALNLFPQCAVIGLAWENSWETSGTKASRARQGWGGLVHGLSTVTENEQQKP